MIILGINETSHDASASLINNNEILFAGHSERYSKIKNDWYTNNDLINDAFIVDEIFNDCVPYTIDFMNRWGQLVYTMNSNDNPFTGKDTSNVDVLEGVYFYTFKSEVLNTHGFVQIIRD
jgi:hypothetical protein